MKARITALVPPAVLVTGLVLMTARLLPAQTVVRIADGDNHSLFVKSDGSLWGMGYNGYGRDGIYTSRSMPVEIVPPPRPVITGISVAGTSVVVTWSTNQGGFILQAASSLVPPVTWSNISTGVLAGNQ